MDTSGSQSPQASFMDRLRGQMNMMALIAGVLAAFGEVTLFRTKFGERYFQGWKTALVIPLLVIFPVFWPREDPSPVMLCLLLYLLMCARHRMSIFRRRARGESGIHSQYNGISRLERRFPKASEETLKSKYEPAVMLGMGLAALTISSPLGWLFIWTAGGMAAHAGLLVAHQRQRVLDMTDAQIEGGMLAGVSREPALDVGSNEVVRIYGDQP